LLRYLPENRSSPRVITGKWLLKNEKVTTRLKNKTWTNPQIKNHKKELCTEADQTKVTTQKSRRYVFKFLTPPIPSVVKTVNLYWFK